MTPDELKKWRDDRDLSQPELADLLGVHWTTVASWEQGRQKLSPFLHLALAELARQLRKKKPAKTIDFPTRIP